MRTLDKILEGLLDTNLDLTDAEALVPAISREVFMETAETINVRGDEVWVDGAEIHIDVDRLKKFGIKRVHSDCDYVYAITSNIVEDFDLIFENQGGGCYFQTYGSHILFKNIQITNSALIKFTSASGDSDSKSYKFENVNADADNVFFGRLDKLSINAKSQFKNATNVTFMWASKAFEKLGNRCLTDPNEVPKIFKILPRSFPKVHLISIQGTNESFNYRRYNSEWYLG